MNPFNSDNISYLKGVGPSRALVLAKELGITTCGDMLLYFPFRIIDRSKVSTIDTFDQDDAYVVFRGVIKDMHTIATGRTERLEATLFDGTGTMQLAWFGGVKWVKEKLKAGVVYLVMGRPAPFNGQWQMVQRKRFI